MKKNILKKVFNYIKKYIPHLILALCLSAITVALSLYFPILVGNNFPLVSITFYKISILSVIYIRLN